jgi:hypothetical protein
MVDQVFRLVIARYATCHQMLLNTALRIDRKRFASSVGSPSLRLDWQIWHIARWTEAVVSELVPSAPVLVRKFGTVEIWDQYDLARRWELTETRLGDAHAGTGLSDDEAERLKLGPPSEVVDYARRVFKRADDVLRVPAALEIASHGPPDEGLLGELISNLDHDNRHLGMVEAIVGALGTKGSADE